MSINSLDWHLPFRRVNKFPLDKDSCFNSEADLDTYIQNGTSYAGQIVAVTNDDGATAYVIESNGGVLRKKRIGDSKSIESDDITVTPNGDILILSIHRFDGGSAEF